MRIDEILFGENVERDADGCLLLDGETVPCFTLVDAIKRRAEGRKPNTTTALAEAFKRRMGLSPGDVAR